MPDSCSLQDVRHQPRAQRLIQRAIAGDRLAAALLFAGPDGVGRERLARRLAALLLCDARVERSGLGIDGLEGWSGPVADACQACDACRACAAGVHPDLHLVDRELVKQHPDPVVRKRRGSIFSVEVVRAFVVDVAGNKPVLGRAKVFVLRDVQRMNESAQNALLKTLEEPPPRTYLMLMTSAPGSVLATIRSRCQIVPFDPLPEEFVVGRLRAAVPTVTADQAALCAEYAGGSLGIAHRFVEDDLPRYDAILGELVRGLPTADLSAAAKCMIDNARKLGERHSAVEDEDATEVESQRRGLSCLFGLMAMRFRRALRASWCAERGAADAPTWVAIEAPTMHPRAAGDAIRALAAAEWQLQMNVNVPLCVDALLIRLKRLIARS